MEEQTKKTHFREINCHIFCETKLMPYNFHQFALPPHASDSEHTNRDQPNKQIRRLHFSLLPSPIRKEGRRVAKFLWAMPDLPIAKARRSRCLLHFPIKFHLQRVHLKSKEKYKEYSACYSVPCELNRHVKCSDYLFTMRRLRRQPHFGRADDTISIKYQIDFANVSHCTPTHMWESNVSRCDFSFGTC